MSLDGRPLHEQMGWDPPDLLAYPPLVNDDMARFLLALDQEPRDPERVARTDWSRGPEDFQRAAERVFPERPWPRERVDRLIARLQRVPVIAVDNPSGMHGIRRFVGTEVGLWARIVAQRRIAAGLLTPPPPLE